MHPFAIVVAISTLLTPSASDAASTVANVAADATAAPTASTAASVTSPGDPDLELRLGLGAWNFNGGGYALNGGVTTRRSRFFATEITADIGRPDRNTPHYGLLTVGVRLATPPSMSSRQAVMFLEVGEALARGLSFTTSPFISVGIEKWQGRIAASRIELQDFRNGHGLRDSRRLLVSLVVPLR